MRKSMVAGGLICLSCFLFLGAPNIYLGSLLFAMGLTFIVFLDLNLFTGKVGFILHSDQIPSLIVMLFLNVLTAYGLGRLLSWINPAYIEAAKDIIASRPTDWLLIFLKSMLCGIFLYMGISGARLVKNDMTVLCLLILCVMGFILTGGIHCIAEAGYYGIAQYDIPVNYITLIAAGNAMGSLFMRFMIDYSFVKEGELI